MNITVVFVLASAWYGATYHILIWVVINILAIMLQRLSKELRLKAMFGKKPFIIKAFDSIITFAFILATFTLLRVGNIGDWIYVMQKAVAGFSFANILPVF